MLNGTTILSAKRWIDENGCWIFDMKAESGENTSYDLTPDEIRNLVAYLKKEYHRKIYIMYRDYRTSVVVGYPTALHRLSKTYFDDMHIVPLEEFNPEADIT